MKNTRLIPKSPVAFHTYFVQSTKLTYSLPTKQCVRNMNTPQIMVFNVFVQAIELLAPTNAHKHPTLMK